MSDDIENTIGDNVAAVLRGYIDDIHAMKVREQNLKEERKGLVKDLKDEGLSASVLLSLHRQKEQDEDKAAAKVDMLKKCAALLGVSAITEPMDDDEAVELREKLGDEVQEYVQDHVTSIASIDEDLKEVSDEIKGKLKTAKNTGFNPKVIMTVVEFKLDPKKAETHRSVSLVLDQYLKAAQVEV